MTYTHYVEERLQVPYRYDRDFSGMVTDVEGRTTRETYRLFVRYPTVVPIADDRFQQLLIGEGRLATSEYGDNYLYSIDELTAYKSVSDRIAVDPELLPS